MVAGARWRWLAVSSTIWSNMSDASASSSSRCAGVKSFCVKILAALLYFPIASKFGLILSQSSVPRANISRIPTPSRFISPCGIIETSSAEARDQVWQIAETGLAGRLHVCGGQLAMFFELGDGVGNLLRLREFHLRIDNLDREAIDTRVFLGGFKRLANGIERDFVVPDESAYRRAALDHRTVERQHDHGAGPVAMRQVLADYHNQNKHHCDYRQPDCPPEKSLQHASLPYRPFVQQPTWRELLPL